MESILTSIKKLLGIEEDYEHFDADIVMHINSALNSLHQLGVGYANGFQITGDTETWEDLTSDERQIGMVRMYIFYNVRLGFDPPANAFVVESINKRLAELEWRLNVSAETDV